jgi:uncharacterized YigZ family protein
MSFYNTIDQEGFAEFKDRGSKFLAYAFPFEDVVLLKPIIQKLKKEHPKAVHFCFAYRVGVTKNIFRSSDDGEPSGSAGKPILGQLDSKEITDTLVVVVRYFGGTLLGVPGLINAYKSAAAMALQVVPIINKPILVKYNILFNYTQMNDIMQVINQFNCVIQKQETQLFCQFTIGVPTERVDNVIHLFKELHNVEITQIL